jgi:hypothetical protein|nr:MAG TPA: helix-turn-helix domain protein [Caudoviricetes sp.]
MTNIEIDRAIKLLTESSENNNQVAKGTGIHPSTISNYRTRTTKPSVPNARLLIEYFMKKNTGTTPTNNNSTNPTNTQAMMDQLAMAMDYISTLKQQLVEKDELIRRLTAGQQTAADEVLSRRLGAVEEKQGELTDEH